MSLVTKLCIVIAVLSIALIIAIIVIILQRRALKHSKNVISTYHLIR